MASALVLAPALALAAVLALVLLLLLLLLLNRADVNEVFKGDDFGRTDPKVCFTARVVLNRLERDHERQLPGLEANVMSV